MAQPQETLAALGQTIDQNPDDARTLAHQGESYRLAGRYQEALISFNQAIELEPDYAWALAHRGETYHLRGHYRAALADFNRALELRPEQAWTLAHRGAIYELMGCSQAALADFDRALELKPDYAWSFVHRGITYMALRHYEKTLADLEQAISFDETILSSVPGERGLVLNFMGRYAETIACCEDGLQVNPLDHIAFYSLAVARACGQGLTEAQPTINETWSILQTLLQNAKNGEERACVLYRLGGLAALAGQTEQALEYLQEAISLDNQPVKLARHDPAWLKLQADPRFQALIAPTILEKQGC